MFKRRYGWFGMLILPSDLFYYLPLRPFALAFMCGSIVRRFAKKRSPASALAGAATMASDASIDAIGSGKASLTRRSLQRMDIPARLRKLGQGHLQRGLGSGEIDARGRRETENASETLGASGGCRRCPCGAAAVARSHLGPGRHARAISTRSWRFWSFFSTCPPSPSSRSAPISYCAGWAMTRRRCRWRRSPRLATSPPS